MYLGKNVPCVFFLEVKADTESLLREVMWARSQSFLQAPSITTSCKAGIGKPYGCGDWSLNWGGPALLCWCWYLCGGESQLVSVGDRCYFFFRFSMKALQAVVLFVCSADPTDWNETLVLYWMCSCLRASHREVFHIWLGGIGGRDFPLLLKHGLPENHPCRM